MEGMSRFVGKRKKKMKLVINWDAFSNKLDSFIIEGENILMTENSINSEGEFESAKATIKDWKDRCYSFLKSAFDSEENDYAQSFYQARVSRFNIGNQNKTFEQIKKETFEDFKVKLINLPYFKKLLSISDAIKKPEIISLSDRSSFTTEEILELLLDKLFDLYDDNHYPITTILEGNGIIAKRHGEDRELAKMLENYGYVDLMHHEETSAQLTTRGKMYVEGKRKTYKENYEDINSSKEDINNRVDEIIESLTKLGYGQQVIFEEIQELKELYTTLNKKNWGQIVKGKLIDLSLAKLIENDTLKYIYETLTDHKLRLP